jgi:hypothetical protein
MASAHQNDISESIARRRGIRASLRSRTLMASRDIPVALEFKNDV